jgi:hypothetical protein
VDIPQELTDQELDALEAVARRATPGPWRWVDNYTLATEVGAGVLTKRRNREYVVAVPPERVVQLVEEIRFLRHLEQIRATSTTPPRRKSNRPPVAKAKR